MTLDQLFCCFIETWFWNFFTQEKWYIQIPSGVCNSARCNIQIRVPCAIVPDCFNIQIQIRSALELTAQSELPSDHSLMEALR